MVSVETPSTDSCHPPSHSPPSPFAIGQWLHSTYSQLYYDNFGNFLRRIAFALVSTVLYGVILKVVCNENQGGSGRWHTFGICLGPWRWRFVCCLILLSSLFSIYFHFFSVHRASPNNSGWFGASIGNTLCKREEKPRTKLPRFAYSWGHRLFILLYLAEPEIHRLKSKTTEKLKEKQSSIAMVRDLLPTFAIFLAHLLSHYRLPLKVHKFENFFGFDFEFCTISMLVMHK